MIVIQFGQDLFHYCLTEKHCLSPYAELVTILSDRSHLTIIQIDDLPVLTHKSFLLLLQIFGIHPRRRSFLLFCHDTSSVSTFQDQNFGQS